MYTRKIRFGPRFVALGLAGALMLAGCASSSGGTSGSVSPSSSGAAGFVGAPDVGERIDGGVLTFGSYSFPSSLDPMRTQAAGSTGGTEMAAIYDTLVRSDSTNGSFVPQLAKTLSNNSDFTSYTVTLADGLTFSDGSPLDAEAVKWSIDRFVAGKGDVSQTWLNIVDRIETLDATTVEFVLERPWRQFPALLSLGPGMIVARSSGGGAGSVSGTGEGAFTPIGAGPFTLAKFAPHEELVLAARTDYQGGKPPLDTVRFVPTSGAQSQYESLKSGQIDMTYILRDEAVIEQALDDGYSGYLSPTGQNGIGTINNREGKPGADVRVRQAIAYGVDPAAVNTRANNGLGTASSDLVPQTSRWFNNTAGIPFDQVKAKALLDQAKSDGYDGKLRYLTTPEPSQQATALTVQASLNAIGFDVTIDYATDVTDLVRRVYKDHDFDMTRGGAPVGEEAPYLNLYNSMASDSKNNPSGFADPEMDAMITAVQTASTDDAVREAISKVQEYANATVPYVIWGPASVLTAWDGNVHGVVRNITDIMFLGGAWISPNGETVER
ncbi:MAG: transporter substrate-binding protein [Rhodococcus erythropolis]|uniref:ABC transporter substrate-binding protein n=1 Tax=Rhodococcus erythropolis TaxID=1833 RepID=A0A8I1D6R4_RHOER|nr:MULTISPECIES: ABC transporter substrate-binding protein [Rhodococcus]ALU72214.1 ABC transporter substrate-binding protein [Rhodococcus erythropolis R138]ATI34228.1 ABC transporter substrate-binding protein [Rhodococcus sp. H-CA8f]MBH5142829.1 ABC transporter substrate-binding protein [Rhodococcus erythropolis]MDF2898671.1 transporter substrate-binding protein [Rhodococcus erythropolis]WGV51299.2 ABC transporter substrate-binding protein [Rhodococcus erythropolis]